MRFLFIVLGLFPFWLQAQTIPQQIKTLNQQAMDSMPIAPEKSLKYTQQAIDLAKDTKNDTLLAFSYKNLGISYYNINQYQEAQKYYFISLKIYEKLQDKEGQYKLINNLGLLYTDWKEYDKAIGYYQKAIEILKSLDKNNLNLGTIYINIGHTYKSKQDYIQSLIYINKGLKIHEEAKNQYGISLGLENLGDTYYEKGEYQRAISSINKALVIAKEIGAKDLELRDYILLSKTHQALKTNLVALQYADKALALAEEMQVLARIVGSHDLLAGAHQNLQNYKEAYQHKQEAYALKDALFNIQKTQAIAGKEVEYETEKKNQQIALQQKENEKKDLQIYVAILVIGITFLVLYIFYKKNQLKKKKNEELQAKNNEIEAQKAQIEIQKLEIEEKNTILGQYNEQLEATVQERTAELLISNQDLKKANDELNNFLYRSYHDLQGPIARIAGLCYIADQLSQGRTEVHPDIPTFFEPIEQQSKIMRQTILKFVEISEIRTKELENTKINLPELVNQVIHTDLVNLPGYEKVIFDVKCKDEVSIFTSHRGFLEKIFLYLLENAVIYNPVRDGSLHQPYVGVHITQNNTNGITISVIDNGMGVHPVLQPKVFDISSRGETSTGLGVGLYLVKIALERLEGEIYLKETRQGYTEFVINIPKANISSNLGGEDKVIQHVS